MLVRAAYLSACLAVLVAPLGAQDGAAWPEGLDEAVRALVGEAWGVAPEAVVLDWGAAAGPQPGPDAKVELLGSGAGGHWVVRVEADPGSGRSVRLRAGHRSVRLVAARRIARGETLGGEDARSVTSLLWGPPAREDAAFEPGWVAQRALDEGDPLVPPAVRAPRLVAPGRPIDVVWRRGAVRVRVPGRAAGAGALGEEVQVRTETGKRLRGIVVAPGVVDVTRHGSREPGA